MRLQAFLESINERMLSKMADNYSVRKASVCIYTKDGAVDVFVKGEFKEVIVTHDRDFKIDSPRLEAYIADGLPTWDEAEEVYKDQQANADYWQSHGFANEADYRRYRMH